MTVKDIENLSIIEDLVKKHFDLNDESLKLFKEKLYDRPIPENVKNDLDESLRIRVKIKKNDYELKEAFDTSWSIFRDFLIKLKIYDSSYTNILYHISYEDYINNKLSFENQNYKLYKFIINKFKENSIDLSYIKEELQRIDTFKLPNKDFEIVLSFNYADWFLSATNEKWSSCLNLNSTFDASYWANLPGIVNDSNRGMLYITDGKKKNFHGIEVDRIIARSWVMLDFSNNFNLVKFYPISMVNNNNIHKLNSLFNENINFTFISYDQIKLLKNKIRLLRNNSQETVYPFQDCSTIEKNGNLFQIKMNLDVKGNQYFDSNNHEDVGKQYLFSDGLDYLIRSNRNIYEFNHNSSLKCADCGDYVEDEFYNSDDEVICQNCFHEHYFECEGFREIFRITPFQPIEHEGGLYSQEYYEHNIVPSRVSNIFT